MANWNKITQDFTQKWIFTKPTTVKDIRFASLDNRQQDYTFALVFEEEGKNSTNVNDFTKIYRNVVTFNKWDGKKADLSSIAYTMMTPLDIDVQNDFSQLNIMTQNRFYMINNHLGSFAVTDYFFNLNSREGTVNSIYSDVLNT